MDSSLNSVELSLLQQLPGCWGCKDTQSVFRYVNHAYAELIGFADPRACIGRRDSDMPSPSSECALEFQQQDLYVMESRRTLKILDIHPYPDGQWHAHIFTKKPWLNEKGEVQGIIFYGQELTETAVLEVGHWIGRVTGLHHQPKPPLDPKRTVITAEDLTPREQEVLFFLLYGKKPQQIAHAMGISVKTIEGHVARLRTKFDATSKHALIEQALDAGFGSSIPKSLLRTQLSVVLN